MALVTQNILEDAKKKKATTTTTTNKMTPGISGLKNAQTKATPAKSTGVTPKVNATVTKSIEKSVSAKPVSAKQTKHVNNSSNAVTNVLNKVKESQGKPIPNTGLTPNKGYTERLKDLRPQEETEKELSSVNKQLDEIYNIQANGGYADYDTSSLEKRRNELLKERDLQKEKIEKVIIPEYQKAYEEALAKGDKEEANRINEIIDAYDDSSFERLTKSAVAGGKNAFATVANLPNIVADISYEKDALGYEEQYKRALAEGNTEEAEYYKERAEESRKRAEGFDALGDSNAVSQWANEIRNESQKIMELERIGASSTDMVMMDVADTVANMAPSIVANMVVPGSGLVVLGGQVFSSTYAQRIEEGYDMQTATNNALATASIEVASEMLGAVIGKAATHIPGFSKLMDTAPAKVYVAISSKLSQFTPSYIQDMHSEGLEEVFSDIVQPWADYFTLPDKKEIEYKPGDIFRDYIMSYPTTLALGAFGVPGRVIKTSKQMYTAQHDLNVLNESEMRFGSLGGEFSSKMELAKRNLLSAIEDFKNNSVVASAIKVQSDMVEDITLDDYLNLYDEALKPTTDKVGSAINQEINKSLQNALTLEAKYLAQNKINASPGVWAGVSEDIKNEVRELADKGTKLDFNEYITETDSKVRQAMVEVAEKNIKGINGENFDAREYMKLTPEEKANAEQIAKTAETIKGDVRVAKLEPGVNGFRDSDTRSTVVSVDQTTTIDANKLMGMEDFDAPVRENFKTEAEFIKAKNEFLENLSKEAGAQESAMTTVGHEVGHSVEETSVSEETENALKYLNGEYTDPYRDLKKAVTEYLGGEENFRKMADRIGAIYKLQNVDKFNAENEAVAFTVQTFAEDPEFFSRVAKYNDSVAYSMYRDFMATLTGNKKMLVENAYARGVAQANRLAAEDNAYDGKMVWLKLVAPADRAKAVNFLEADGAEMIRDNNENIISFVANDGSKQFNRFTYNDSGREILENNLKEQVERGELTQTDADAIMSEMEYLLGMTDHILENSKDYEGFAKWADTKVELDANGNPVLSCVVSNGEYKMNIDFSRVCKKRATLNQILNSMIGKGIFDASLMAEEDYAMINQIIREHGFEVACGLCFVDSKRYMVSRYATTFANPWNAMIKAVTHGKNVSDFNYGGAEGRNTVDEQFTPDYEALEKLLQTPAFKSGENTKPLYRKMADLIEGKGKFEGRTDLALKALHTINPNDMVSSFGMNAFKKDFPELYGIMNGHMGVAKPKTAHTETQYQNEILKMSLFDVAKAFEIGGVRFQSFSDFRANMYFDYMQAFADMAAKGLPEQSYTKEPAFAKLYGLTGAKINMSILSAVDPEDLKALRKLQTTYKNGVIPPSERATNILLRRVGLDSKGNYVWGTETFPVNDAFNIQDMEGYDRNCGTILVGLSYEHIKKALADKRIKMVIPYHKSGLPHIVATMNNIEFFTDYTDFQNEGDPTKLNDKGNPTKLTAEQKEQLNFNFYREMEQLASEALAQGDPALRQELLDEVPKRAAEALVRRCEELHFTPRFAQFAYNIIDGSTEVKYDAEGNPTNVERDVNGNTVINPDYYKTITDYSLYDRNGHFCLFEDRNGNLRTQDFIHMNFPKNVTSGAELKADPKEYTMEEYISEILKDQQVTSDRLGNEILDMEREVTERLAMNREVRAAEEGQKGKRTIFPDNTVYSVNYFAKVRNEKGRMQKRNVHEEFDTIEEARARAIEVGETIPHYDRQVLITKGEGNYIGRYDNGQYQEIGRNVQLSKGVSPQTEAEYDQAVANNDMDTAQRLVDEVAIGKGLKKVYHGSPETFNEFRPDPWSKEVNGDTNIQGFFSEDPEYSKSYGYVKPYYIDPGKVLEVDDYERTPEEWKKWLESKGIKNVKFDSGSFEDTLLGARYPNGPTRYALYELISHAGYYWHEDGNLTQKIREAGYDTIHWDYGEQAYMPLRKNVIKSADPVTYDDNGNVIPLSKRFSDKTNDTRYSVGVSPQMETDYDNAVKNGDMDYAGRIVNRAASSIPTIAKDSRGKALRLYHGTPRFGFTEFADPAHKVPFIYTSTASEVSAHYAGDQNYAFRRPIGTKYREGNSTSDIIENAKWVLNRDLSLMTDQQKEKAFNEVRDEAVKIADKLDGEYYIPFDDFYEKYGSEVANAIEWIKNLFWDIRDGDYQYDFSENNEDNEEWRKNLSFDLERYKDNKEILKDFFNDHYSELNNDEKEYIRYLLGFEVGDAAIYIESRMLNTATEEDRLTDKSGQVYIPSNLKKYMDATHNIGSYELYGDLGDNPFEFDANGAQWTDLRIPEIGDGSYSTDYVSKWAYDNGYSSVIMHNIRDYGDKADNYVFFDSSQLKSADPVTYDDNGNVIPLNERFNPSNKDIRYSMGLKPEQTVRLKSGKIPAKVGKIIQKAYNAFDEGYSNDMEQFGVSYEDVADEFLEAANEVATNGEISKETMDRLRDILYYGVENVYEPGERGKDVYEQIKDILKKHPLSNSAIGQKYVDYGADGKKHMTRLHKGMTQGTLNDMRRNGIRFKNGGYDLGELENVFKEAGLGEYFPDTRTFSDLEDFNKTLSDLQLSLQNQTHKSYDMAEFAEETEESFNQFFDETMKQFVEDVSGKQMSDQAAEVIDSLDVSDEEFNKFVKRDPISPRALENITKHKKELVDTAPEWIPNYDIIRESHPEFTDLEMNDALFEILSEGTISESTAWRIKEDMLRRLSVNDNEEANQSIKELIDDSVALFGADAAYKMDKKLNDAAARATNTFLRSFSGNADPDIFGKYGTYFDAMKQMKLTDKDIKKRRSEAAKYRAEDIQELVANGKNFGSQWMTLGQNGDVITKNDPVLRERFTNLFEVPKDAADRIALEIKTKYSNKLNDIVKSGIRGGTKESAAVQYMLEGHTEKQTKQRVYENDNPNPVVKNVYEKYTLDDLKRDFPESWQKINNAAKTLREMYDEMYNLIQETREKIYGEASAKAELEIAKTREQLNTSKKAIEEIKRQLKENPDAKLEAGLNQEEQRQKTLDAKLQTMLAEKANRDLTRRQELLYRKNYAHHIYKQGGFFTQMAEIMKSENKIPTKIAGITSDTQPYSRFSTAFLEQHQTDSYFPDAINGMKWYINEASNIVGYDPYIEHLRSVINDIRSIAEGNDMNKTVAWLQQYADSIAGKTQSLDRGIRYLLGDKAIKFLGLLNNSAKGNVILGNPGSALVQIANLPNGLGILTQRGGVETTVDIAKGIAQYFSNIGRDGETIQSPFLQNRYLEIDTKTGNILSRSARAFTRTMLEVGDHEAAKIIWNIAYQQGLRKGEPDAVFYADDITRRAIAGRGVGEMPLAMEAETIKALLPFQVEANNAYQTIKLYGRKKDLDALAGFVVMIVSSTLLNNLFEAVLHRRPGFDPIDAVLDGLEESKDKDLTTQATIVGTRLAGEFLGTMPGTSLVMNLAGMTDDQKKKIFGDTDITRYNTGNIGLQPLVSSANDLVSYLTADDKDKARAKAYNAISDIASTYLAPGGGKQIQRTIEGLQSEGMIPQYVNGEWINSPAYYTQSGKLGFVNDPNDIFDVITAGTLGRWHTKAAQEYLNGGRYLSDTQNKYYEALSDALGQQEAYNVAKELSNISGIKDENGKTVSNSASLAKRKYLEDLGVWDEYAEAMGDDYQGWDIGKKVATASDEEFDKMYSEVFGEGMRLDVASAAGMKETLDTNKEEKESKTDANLDFLAGTPYEKAAIQNLDMDEDVLQTVTDLGYDYKTIKQIDDYIDNTDSLRKEDGSAIRNTKALQMRQYYEEMGVYDDIFSYISENGLDPQDYGLNKTVMGYSDSKFESQYSKYYGGGSSSSGGSSKSSYSSGSSGGRKSSGRRKSSKKKGFSSEEEMKAFFDQLVANIGLSSSKSSTSAINNILKKSKNLRNTKFSKRSS